MSAENRLTSIVSYPERGTGGNNRYRGNCSPKLIEDLIGFFRPAEICDYMCGSGTTQDAAHSMGIISHCYDLHSGFDLINCEIPERPEFVFWHPPYWDTGASKKASFPSRNISLKRMRAQPRRMSLGYLPMSLKKRRRSILPSIKGVSTGRSSSKSMAIAQSWTLQWWTP